MRWEPSIRPRSAGAFKNGGLLPVNQPVGRVAARGTIEQRALLAQPSVPAVHPDIADTEDLTRPAVNPAGGNGVADELEEPLVGRAVDA